MTPYVADPDFTLYQGDVLDVLAGLPDESVHCCVTSPPYWGLRDYGTGSWDGGDPDCDHIGGTLGRQDAGRDFTGGGGNREGSGNPGKQQFRDACGKCGASRVDQQLGLEATPELYVARMVAVFAEVRRVLRKDGTCWLNIGDSYASGEVGRVDAPAKNVLLAETQKPRAERRITQRSGLKPKDLVGIPWRLAFALQADGWYLRSDIIWSKPNPMPESVTDRPTKAHEYLFLLTKSARYYFDQDAVRVPSVTLDPEHPSWRPSAPAIAANGRKTFDAKHDGEHSQQAFRSLPAARKIRSVWEIATEPYPDAHFATYPQALIEPCIKAGCPEHGIVLDPFLGSGTTALVARRHNRRSIGIELNPDYARLAAKRLSQLSLLAEEGAA